MAFHRTVTLPRWRLTNRLPAHGANRWRLSNMPFFPSPRPFGSILFRIFGVIVLAPLPAIGGFPRLLGAIRAIPLTGRCVDKLLAAHLAAAYALSEGYVLPSLPVFFRPSFVQFLSYLTAVGAVPRAWPAVKNSPALATSAGGFRRHSFFHCPIFSIRARRCPAVIFSIFSLTDRRVSGVPDATSSASRWSPRILRQLM